MECPVCLEIYKTPLLLPGCGHTICRACAEMIITEGNYLRCPECRLVYQLRKGVQSLPKNVALQRTIDEHNKAANRQNVMCEQHPDESATLYCKTCEKSICLKCYFTNNTLRRGQSLHNGHQVDTSEDAFTKEMRIFDEILSSCEARRDRELQYCQELETVDRKLKESLESKLAAIEKHKNDIISRVKQTAAKLKFTLKGSASRDQEFLQMALESCRERHSALKDGVEAGQEILYKAANETTDINMIKDSRRALESLPEASADDKPDPESFMKIDKFDTDLEGCLQDSKRALSYQTEKPRTPSLSEDSVVASDTCACLQLTYDQAVRVKRLRVHYKEAMYKGFSEKSWTVEDVQDLNSGVGRHVLKNLLTGTMYRMYVVACNDVGDSAPSNELRFRTADAEMEKRIT